MKTFLFILMLFPTISFGQTAFENTLEYDETLGSPEASLEDVKWISGRWTGEAFGGTIEEIWSPPLGNSMMCVFKLLKDGEAGFYEIVTITEENNSLILRLKHFHGDLKGWEEKDETVDFKLVKVTPGKVYFDGFTFEKISGDEITIYVRISHDHTVEEVPFKYKRSEL